MSQLRGLALAAAEAEREEREREAAELARLDAEKAITMAVASPLGEWFPDVTWEFMFEGAVGMKVVREKGETSPVFGITVIDRNDQGPVDYAVYILRRPALSFAGLFSNTDPGWEVAAQPTCAGDVGRYIEAITPKTAPVTEVES